MTAQKKWPEVHESLVEITPESFSDMEQKKLKDQADQERENLLREESLETEYHENSFDSEVEELQRKIEANQIPQQEAKRLYDEITAKYDKTFWAKAVTSLESTADKMGMRDKVTDKWNIKNTLLWTGWVAAAGYVAMKWKSWFGKKEKKEDKVVSTSTPTVMPEQTSSTAEKSKSEGKNRRQRNRWWVVGGTATAGVATGAAYLWREKLHKIPLIGNSLDKLFNPQALTLDQAFTNFQADVSSSSIEKHFRNMSQISYEVIDDKKIKLKSYGKEIIIDKDKRVVAGMEDVVFPNFSEMLHAANMINFSAAAFQGICDSDKPFNISSMWWDIEVHLLDIGDEEVVSGAGIPIGKYAGATVGVLSTVVGAIYGNVPWAVLGAWIGVAAVGAWHVMDRSDTLSKFCPTLNNDVNKEKFRARLNTLPNLTQGDQDIESVAESPLQTIVQEVITELTETELEDETIKLDKHGNVRLLDAVPVPGIPDSYDIVSWRGNTTRVTYKGDKIIIEWLKDIPFDAKEGIRVANLTNKIKAEYMGKGKSRKPFVYRGGVGTMWYPGLYIATKDRRVGSGSFGEYRIVKKSTLEKISSTLQEKIESDYIPYLHTMQSANNTSLWI